jgi:hypothetical protein
MRMNRACPKARAGGSIKRMLKDIRFSFNQRSNHRGIILARRNVLSGDEAQTTKQSPDLKGDCLVASLLAMNGFLITLL